MPIILLKSLVILEENFSCDQKIIKYFKYCRFVFYSRETLEEFKDWENIKKAGEVKMPFPWTGQKKPKKD